MSVADEREAAREAAREATGFPHNGWWSTGHYASAFRAGFDAGTDWQREQDQARIAKLESDLRIERGRMEGLQEARQRAEAKLAKCTAAKGGRAARTVDLFQALKDSLARTAPEGEQ